MEIGQQYLHAQALQPRHTGINIAGTHISFMFCWEAETGIRPFSGVSGLWQEGRNIYVPWGYISNLAIPIQSVMFGVSDW